MQETIERMETSPGVCLKCQQNSQQEWIRLKEERKTAEKAAHLVDAAMLSRKFFRSLTGPPVDWSVHSADLESRRREPKDVPWSIGGNGRTELAKPLVLSETTKVGS